MSRNSKIVENPAIRTFVWKNKKTKKDVVLRETGWYYYDKNANDGQGDNIKVDFPLNFIWLETAQSFTGYSEKEDSGLYSNEILTSPEAVAKYGKKELVLKCKTKELCKGFYADIKEEAKGYGAKYCNAVYAMMQIEGNWEIVRFLMSGSSGSAWMSFNNKTQNVRNMISCTGSTEIEMKTGATYEAPVFQYISVSPEVMDLAEVKCDMVDEYFDYMFNNPLAKPQEDSHNHMNDDDSNF